MPKWISLGLLTLILSWLAGCVTAGDFCDVSDPIRPSAEDRLTEHLSRQILKHDRYGAKTFGWRPQ